MKIISHTVVRYKLYKDSDEIYLSPKQAECIAHLLHGRTIRMAAEKIGISARTAEDYLFKIRKKLKCKNKAELIEKVLKSDFMETAAALIQQIRET